MGDGLVRLPGIRLSKAPEARPPTGLCGDWARASDVQDNLSLPGREGRCAKKGHVFLGFSMSTRFLIHLCYDLRFDYEQAH